MTPKQFSQESIIAKGKQVPIVNVIFELKTAVRSDIYDFIVNN